MARLTLKLGNLVVPGTIAGLVQTDQGRPGRVDVVSNRTRLYGALWFRHDRMA